MLFSKALSGFFMTLRADGYSESTVDLYSHDLYLLCKRLGDPDLDEITQDNLVEFFVYLREVYHKETGRGDKLLSGSTLQNYWKAMRTFFEWAKGQKLISERPDTDMKMPRNNPREVLPLEQEEVKRLIECAEYSFIPETEHRAAFKMKCHFALRNVALILLLLDTGMRAGEAGRLDVCDVDLVNSEIFIQPYGSSMRKTKSRAIPIGKSTQRALWKYLASRDDPQPDDPFFLGLTGKAIDNHTILQIVRKLGDKAGIKNCHPHRLRHTFAIEYLRNGGDIFTLQKILGHSSLEMVQHYLAVAKTDTAAAHKRASPADRWRL